jgi:hypothetical protein
MRVIKNFTNKTSPIGGLKTTVLKAERVIDFSLVPCISGDVVECLDVEAGDIVLTAGLKVLAGEAGNVELGYGVDPNYWVTSQSVASTGTFVANGANIAAGSLAFAAADTLDLTLSADFDSGKVAVYAVIAKLES